MVQTLFAVLGALSLVGSTGAAAYVGALSGPVAQLALGGAGGVAGVVLLAVTFSPLSNTARTIGMIVMGVVSLGALAGGAVVGIPAEVLLFELVGALLAFCAAIFPVLVDLVK